jgi:hypothetical protein
MNDVNLLQILLPAGIGLLGVFIAYGKLKQDNIEASIKVRERLTALEVKVDSLESKVSFYFESIIKDAAKILHTPHEYNARRDYLLEQFVSQQITSEELKELIECLKTIIDNKALDMGERTAASNMLRALEIQYNL